MLVGRKLAGGHCSDEIATAVSSTEMEGTCLSCVYWEAHHNGGQSEYIVQAYQIYLARDLQVPIENPCIL